MQTRLAYMFALLLTLLWGVTAQASFAPGLAAGGAALHPAATGDSPAAVLHQTSERAILAAQVPVPTSDAVDTAGLPRVSQALPLILKDRPAALLFAARAGQGGVHAQARAPPVAAG